MLYYMLLHNIIALYQIHSAHILNLVQNSLSSKSQWKVTIRPYNYHPTTDRGDIIRILDAENIKRTELKRHKSLGHIKTFDFWWHFIRSYKYKVIYGLHYNVYFVLKAESMVSNDHDQTHKNKHRKSFPKNIIIY